VTLPEKAATSGRRVRLSALAGFGVLVAAASCTAPTSANSTSSPPVYVAIVLRIQQVGPAGTTPAQAKQAASAVDCRVFVPLAHVPAGATYVVHLKVGTTHVTSSVKALAALHDVYDVHAEPEASFSATPTDVGPEGNTPC